MTDKQAKQDNSPLRGIQVRYVIVILATLCPTVCYISRQNLSMAIVAMVESSPTETSQTRQNLSSAQEHSSAASHHDQHQHYLNASQVEPAQTFPTCPLGGLGPSDNSTGNQQQSPKAYGPKFHWSVSDISLIFEAFFITYVLCQIPAGRFSEVVGAGYILLTATLGSATLSGLIPFAASLHPWLFALIRALMGICQSALYPACYVLYTHWLPPNERSVAFPFLMVGAFVGSIITSTVTGYLSELPAFGWEYSFYLAALINLSWAILWLLLGSSKPRQHRFIKESEIYYIESRMEARAEAEGNRGEELMKSPSWMKLLKSPAIFAMNCAFFASNWSFTILLLLLPRYLNDILHISPFKNGLINSTLYLIYCISAPTIGSISTLMIQFKLFGMSSLMVRKFFQVAALFGQSICFLLIIFFGCDVNSILITLYSQMFLYSFVNGGEVQLPSELSLDFAGTIFAIGNCVGSSTGFMVPRFQSIIVPNSLDRGNWEKFFYLASTISFVGGSVFLFLAQNNLHDFSKAPTTSKLKSETIKDENQKYLEIEKNTKSDQKNAKEIIP